jgi:hypothetical protein
VFLEEICVVDGGHGAQIEGADGTRGGHDEVHWGAHGLHDLGWDGVEANYGHGWLFEVERGEAQWISFSVDESGHDGLNRGDRSREWYK